MPPIAAHEFGPLQGLPKLAALDSATQQLFAAIDQRDTAAAQEAISQGARLDQPRPFTLVEGNIVGGLDPLHTVCSPYPGGLVDLPMLALLLQQGALPRPAQELDNADLFDRLAQALPRNGKGAAEILISAGLTPRIQSIHTALMAEKMWTENSQSRFCVPLVEALWEGMDPAEQKKLSAYEFLRQCAEGETLSEEYAKRVRWVSGKEQQLQLSPPVNVDIPSGRKLH